MHNLIFPLAGFGKRFQEAGYIQTKPLIHAGKKTIIEWGLESVVINEDINIIFIVRQDQCITNGIDSYLKQLHKNCTIVKLDKATNGSLETVLLAIKKLSLKGFLHIHTSDIVLPKPVLLNTVFEEKDIDAASFTFKANNPSYSYCKLSESDSNKVEYMIEKEVISQVANIGIYSFKSIDKFIKYAEEIINEQKTIKSEYYISSVFENLIKDGNKVKSITLPEVHIIGTPKELTFFTKFVIPTMNPKTIGLVSDHSGFFFKDELRKLFQKADYEVVDYGCFSKQDCDYSDYVPIASEGLEKGEVDIIIGSCKSGQGINTCANHQNNILSVIPNNENSLFYARMHNCPNWLSFASDVWDPNDAFTSFQKVYRTSHFEGGRHSTRIQKFL